jgi:hypothetical protein
MKTERVTAPGRYWAIQKDGTTVMKRETIADDPSSISYVIPAGFEVVELDSLDFLESESVDTSVLTDSEQELLHVP